MALTDAQKLEYIVPLVVNGTQAIDDGVVALAQQLHDVAQAAFEQGIAAVQPNVEALLGHALTDEQVASMRSELADRLNQTLRTLTVG